MKAILQDAYGTAGDLVLADIDRPTAAPGEVRVRVHAASVFIGDWHVLTGLPYAIRPKLGMRRPKARVAGQEMAGRVEAVGEGVTRFRQGGDVFGTCSGAFAEYVAVPEGLLAPTPSNLTAEQAATVAIGRPVSDLRRALTSRGTLVIVGGEGGGRWVGKAGRMVWGPALSPFVSQTLTTLAVKHNGADLVVLKDYIEAGKITPVIGRTYELREVPDAIRDLEQRRTVGKSVVIVRGPGTDPVSGPPG